MELDKEITGIILFWIGFSLMVFAGSTTQIMFYLELFVIIEGLILFWIGQKNDVNEDIKLLIEKVENLHREIRRIEAERVKESIKRWIDQDLNGDKNG